MDLQLTIQMIMSNCATCCSTLHDGDGWHFTGMLGEIL